MSPAGEEERRHGLAIAARRASMSQLISRSAPGSLTLAQLAPLRSESGSSLPGSPVCSVGTQTPNDSLHFEYPDPFDSTDDIRVRLERLSTSRSLPVDVRSSWLPRFHTNLFRGGGVNRRMLPDLIPGLNDNEGQRRHNSMSLNGVTVAGIEGVGQQLRSIGDDFDRTRITRSRSLSFVSLSFGRRRGSVP